jgi:hypothetical protein
MHLQSLGKWVSAKEITQYIVTSEFQARLCIKPQITVHTAQHWMKKMGYQRGCSLMGMSEKMW